jgi:hypothetical protein
VASGSPRPVRDEGRDIGVQLGHGLVEGGEPGSAGPRELGQIGFGDLAVADDSLDRDVRVRKIIGPELVLRVAGGRRQDRPRRSGGLALPDEQAQQAALGDRAGREGAVQSREPVLGGRVLNVIVDEQRDEHVGVEEDGHWSSSSSCRTSSVVIVLPRCATGRPVRALVVISPG